MVYHRELESVNEWFPAPNNWQSPIQVTIGSGLIHSVQMVEGLEGDLHAFWVQQNQDGDRLAHSQWDGRNGLLSLLYFPMPETPVLR